MPWPARRRCAADQHRCFDRPSTFPDFTDCSGTTPELDVDWKATITQGGHGRGFSPHHAVVRGRAHIRRRSTPSSAICAACAAATDTRAAN